MIAGALEFQAIFAAPPTGTASAPGRVNLIGEHTDYNGGFVLPTAIPQRASVWIRPRADRTLRLASREIAPSVPGIVTLDLSTLVPRHDWTDYVAGCAWALRREGFGDLVTGFDLLAASDVPLGSGLSSSAALLVATLRILRATFCLDLDDVRIAQLAQGVENDFVGARVGIMDQMAASLADGQNALFLDTRDLIYRMVPVPGSVLELAVINSGVKHDHATGGYNTRRAECEEACRLLGVGQLRDLGTVDLPRLDRLSDVLRRRARHVITENARVLAAVEALESGKAARLGELFFDSHASMRLDYEVSVPQIDRLVEIARERGDVFGARLTGGGFGGSIVMACAPGRAREAALAVAAEYAARGPETPTVLVPSL